MHAHTAMKWIYGRYENAIAPSCEYIYAPEKTLRANVTADKVEKRVCAPVKYEISAWWYKSNWF